MMQQYDTAFRISFSHEFFSDSKLRSMVIKPTEETAALLRNIGGIVKNFENGIAVLFESMFNQSARSRAEFLKNRARLKFIVNNQDSAFFNYTADFNQDISCSYFAFGNSDQPDGLKRKELHANSFAGQDDLKPVKPGEKEFFIKPFGMVSILLHEDLDENLKVSFGSRSSYWCYLLTAPHLMELTAPAIIHKETKEVFAGPEQFSLDNDTTVTAFFSTSPLALQERPEAIFQLVEAYNPATRSYRVVIPALPTPNRQHISAVRSITALKKQNYSFIFI